jgi:hypothetical protein
MRRVMFEGRERALATLCRELQIDRRTVESRLDRGMDIDCALRSPPRNYPSSRTKKNQAEPAPQPGPHPLVKDAIDIMIDAREVLIAIEATPRRSRILAGIRQWLRRAGWR